MSLKFKPLGSLILIEPARPESRTKSGIIIPEQSKEKPLYGGVISVGKDVSSISIGDVVLYDKRSARQQTSVDGKELIFMKEEDVIAIIEK